MSKTILPRKKEVPAKINFYTKEELQTFLEIVKANDNLKQYAFFRLIAFTGMRKSEDYFKLVHNTKSEKQFVFTNKNNELYYPQVVNDWLNWIYDKFDKQHQNDHDELKTKRISPHGFRHTHCSLLFESGASIKEVQERLGHKDIKTTMNIYAHITPKQAEETGQKFAKYMSF